MIAANKLQEMLVTVLEWQPRDDGQPGWSTKIDGRIALLSPQADGTLVVTYRGASKSLATRPARWRVRERAAAPPEQPSQAPPDLSRPLSPELFRRVVSDPRYCALPSLHLRGRTGHGDSFDAGLAVFSMLPFECEELVLDEVSASPEAWARWARAPGIRQLKRLGLKFTSLKDFNDRAFEGLVRSVEGLEVLSFFWLDFTLAKLEALVASPLSRTLEALCLGNSEITPQMVDLLLGAAFPRLKQLHLRELDIKGPAEQLLRSHPSRPALRALEIKRYDARVWVSEPNPAALFFPAAAHRYVKTQPEGWSVHQHGDFASSEDNHVVEHVPAHSVVRYSLGPLRVGTAGCQWPRCHSRLPDVAPAEVAHHEGVASLTARPPVPANKSADELFARGIDALTSSYSSADSLTEMRGDREDALTAFEQALAIDPHHLGALRERAQTLALLDNDAEAADAYVAALSRSPGDLGLTKGAAGCFSRLGHHAEALQAAEQALRAEPSHEWMLRVRAAALTALGQDEAALAAWDALLRGDGPWATHARLSRAMVLARLGRPEAGAAFHACISQEFEVLMGPLAPPVFFAALRDLEPARQALRAHTAQLATVRACFTAAHAWLRATRPTEALEAAEFVIARTPAEASAWLLKGEAHVARGEVALGVKAFERSLELDPGFLAARSRLAAVAPRRAP